MIDVLVTVRHSSTIPDTSICVIIIFNKLAYVYSGGRLLQLYSKTTDQNFDKFGVKTVKALSMDDGGKVEVARTVARQYICQSSRFRLQ